jgi:hypothetical protein
VLVGEANADQHDAEADEAFRLNVPTVGHASLTCIKAIARPTITVG